MNIVLDTNVLVAAVRSPVGASAEIVRRVLTQRLPILCSVPLFIEYEAVLLRPEHLKASGVERASVINLLDVLAGKLTPVSIHFLWRPQLKDPNDDLVLEVAANGQGLGEPVGIVTFNGRDFLPQSLKFGVSILTPRQFFQQDERSS
jgi:putative PIN family toxin of toxin-antitoxin system